MTTPTPLDPGITWEEIPDLHHYATSVGVPSLMVLILLGCCVFARWFYKRRIVGMVQQVKNINLRFQPEQASKEQPGHLEAASLNQQ